MQSDDDLRRENEALRQRIARTRADLETLVETSPVGMVVFDAGTGRPVSFNREAARMVEALGPGRPPGRVIEAVTCRFADGRELALARLPLSPPAGAAALRAEEIVLSVPDGREVRTLVNAVPIRGDGGEVDSVVVTLQDLEPLEKLERLRAELLGTVGHELRAPLIAIKGSTATVLGAAAALDPAEMLQFFRTIDEQADHLGSLIADLLARVAPTPPAADEASRDAAGAPREAPDGSRDEGHQTPILVVDDDPETRSYVCDALSSAGYAPLATDDPGKLPELVRAKRPRLVLLDPARPEADGIEPMRRVRELADIPVIFISGYGRDETIAEALELGAADYIVKPFSPTELTARVQAALRRLAERVPYRAGDLAIDYEQRRVTVAGRRVDLTAIEYELLRVLSTGGGRVSTVGALLRQVWGGRRAGDPKLLRAFVKRLRRKLGDDAASPAYIFTERGVGYRMAAPGDPADAPSA